MLISMSRMASTVDGVSAGGAVSASSASDWMNSDKSIEKDCEDVAKGRAHTESAVRFALEVSREDLHEVDNDSTRESRQRRSNHVQ
jgi:hypothetical protein